MKGGEASEGEGSGATYVGNPTVRRTTGESSLHTHLDGPLVNDNFAVEARSPKK